MKGLYLALLTLCVISCQQKHLTQEELIAYIADEENGLKKSVTLGETNISVIYRPTDLLIQQEIEGEHDGQANLKALEDKYGKYFYFILSLSKNKKEVLHQVDGGFAQYSDLVNTLSFRMPEYVTLTTNASDTIPVGDFMLNRTYGLSEDTQVLFVFNKEKSKEKEWVQFNLNEFGLGVGNQRFRFRTKDLLEAPKISL